MSRYEWLLFLHVLSAALTVTGVVALGTIVVGSRRGEAPALRVLTPVATMAWNVGGIAVLIFGIWLALDVDRYDLLDGWILAAIALWLVATGTSGPVLKGLREGITQQTVTLWAIGATATAALLIDMIFKPGA